MFAVPLQHNKQIPSSDIISAWSGWGGNHRNDQHNHSSYCDVNDKPPKPFSKYHSVINQLILINLLKA